MINKVIIVISIILLLIILVMFIFNYTEFFVKEMSGYV